MAQIADCLIIGAGQAGLAMSQCLTTTGIDHVVLERGTIGNRWTSQRWPSLRLLTPSWMTRLPGCTLAGRDEGFLFASDLADRLLQYRRDFGLPVIEGLDVLALESFGDRFRAVTSGGTWVARSVVIATGACDCPLIPRFGAQISPKIHQLDSTQYRSPDELPHGGVLVVGGSATGVQLAGEIARSGRRVMLAAGSHVRTPRRYRGRDLFDWLEATGFLADKATVGQSNARLMAQPSLQLVGSPGKQDVDLYCLANEGVIVTGRVRNAGGATISFEDDLPGQLELAEARRRKILARIDAFVEQSCLEVPEEDDAWRDPGILLPLSGAINLESHGIASVIWATGYRRDYSWLHFDACDGAGELRQEGGICQIPGLFALGLPFMRHRASSFIDGVGRDAEALLPVIAAHLGASIRIAA